MKIKLSKLDHARTFSISTLTEVHLVQSGTINCSGIVLDSPVITSIAT